MEPEAVQKIICYKAYDKIHGARICCCWLRYVNGFCDLQVSSLASSIQYLSTIAISATKYVNMEVRGKEIIIGSQLKTPLAGAKH